MPDTIFVYALGLFAIILSSFGTRETFALSITAVQTYELTPDSAVESFCQAEPYSNMADDEIGNGQNSILFDSGDGYLSMIAFSPNVKCPSKGRLSGVLWGSFLFESSINIPINCNVDVTVNEHKLLVHYRCKDLTDKFCLPKCTFAYQNAPCLNPPSRELPYPFRTPIRTTNDESGAPVLYTLQLCNEPCPSHPPTM